MKITARFDKAESEFFALCATAPTNAIDDDAAYSAYIALSSSAELFFETSPRTRKEHATMAEQHVAGLVSFLSDCGL